MFLHISPKACSTSNANYSLVYINFLRWIFRCLLMRVEKEKLLFFFPENHERYQKFIWLLFEEKSWKTANGSKRKKRLPTITHLVRWNSSRYFFFLHSFRRLIIETNERINFSLLILFSMNNERIRFFHEPFYLFDIWL